MSGLLDDQISKVLDERSSGHPVIRSSVLSIASLSLHHFRNYEQARIEISPAPVVLTGPNGAGKTNILEALSLLAPGRGLRRARLTELDRMAPVSQEEHHWAVSATVNGMQGEAQIGTGYDFSAEEGSNKRLLRIDAKPVRSHAELARHMAIVWLTPQMEQLFAEGASAGRKFLDRLVYNFEPEHAARVNEYEFAMRERNKLLQTGRWDTAWLEALEQTMAETAAAIAGSRLATAQTINHTIAASPLSFPKAIIHIEGLMEGWIGEGKPAVFAEESFKSLLAANRNQDAAAGRALAGAHRSELCVIHAQKQLPAQRCSTGEQKAVLLSIVLAQARAAAAWRGIVPVLLLDEVIAHLDGTRKLELFEEICQIGAQTWMTGTDARAFAELEQKARLFRVENGHIR
jgi:DNA replication and repair protein RecF